MRDEGTRTVTAGKAGTAMETTKLGAFAHVEKCRTWTPHESHRVLEVGLPLGICGCFVVGGRAHRSCRPHSRASVGRMMVVCPALSPSEIFEPKKTLSKTLMF